MGGYAVAFHGAPRFTGGLDILVHPTLDHVQRTLAALKELGFPSEKVAAGDVLEWDSQQQGYYGGVPVFFIGRGALAANKRAAGRAKDLADVNRPLRSLKLHKPTASFARRRWQSASVAGWEPNAK